MICTCSVGSDDEMDRVNKLRKRLTSRLSDEALVMALGELEATSHERACDWYDVFLGQCEIRWVLAGE
jgi:hypothetical protein